MCFYIGKNALSTFAFLVFVRVCVAAIGALRFSARGFGCALFLLLMKPLKKGKGEKKTNEQEKYFNYPDNCYVLLLERLLSLS